MYSEIFVPSILTIMLALFVGKSLYTLYFGPSLWTWFDTERGMRVDKAVNAAVSSKVREILKGEHLIVFREKMFFHTVKGEEPDSRIQYYVQTDNGSFSFVMANDLPRMKNYWREGRARIINISDNNGHTQCVNDEFVVTLDTKTFNILNKTALRTYRENRAKKETENNAAAVERKEALIESLTPKQK